MANLRFHSMVGLVSNSSSTTYTMNKDKVDELLYKHLNAVLAAAGVDAKAEDVFEVVVQASEDGYIFDRLVDQFIDTGLDQETYDAYQKQGVSLWNAKNWPDDVRAKFDTWRAAKDDVPAISVDVDWGGEGSPRIDGAVFIKRRDTGEVDMKLSASAFNILDVVSNGDADY